MHPAFQAFLADTSAQSGAEPDYRFLLTILAGFAVFYFIVIRPQQKQQKQLKNLVSALKKGDEVFTQSGLIGTVAQVEDQVVLLDVGGGNKLKVLKSTVAGAWKPAPAQAPKQEKK